MLTINQIDVKQLYLNYKEEKKNKKKEIELDEERNYKMR